jgi:hypothetical protein
MAGMIPVAVVLIVLVIVFTIAIIIGNPQSFDLQVFVARIPANITGVYVTGAVTMLVLAVAGWLLWTGIVRMRARQQELRALKAAAGKSTKKAITPESGKAAKDKTPSSTATASERDKEAAAPKRAPEAAGDPKRAADSSPKDAGVSRTAAAEDADPSGTGTDSAKPRGDRDLGDDDQPSTTPEERRRLLAETDDLTRDDK